jgi:hypothetical protein
MILIGRDAIFGIVVETCVLSEEKGTCTDEMNSYIGTNA